MPGTGWDGRELGEAVGFLVGFWSLAATFGVGWRVPVIAIDLDDSVGQSKRPRGQMFVLIPMRRRCPEVCASIAWAIVSIWSLSDGIPAVYPMALTLRGWVPSGRAWVSTGPLG